MDKTLVLSRLADIREHYISSIKERRVSYAVNADERIIKILEELPEDFQNYLIDFRKPTDSFFGDPYTRIRKKIESLDKLIDQFAFCDDDMNTTEINFMSEKAKNRIFIVHGKEEGIKQATARLIERIGLTPIVLHEQTSKGKTIIEKFEEYSDVSYAIVLLTPDDQVVSSTETDTKFRARQNVIFELGYFIGKLGRNRVFPLYKKCDNFEFPSDYQGVVYHEYDSPRGTWVFNLVHELNALNYKIDLKKIL